MERRARGEYKKLDDYHLMDCCYTLEDYPQAAAYARAARDSADRPIGSADRPHAVLLQSLILMHAPDAEIREAYDAACTQFPEKADFPLIYGAYAWAEGYRKTAEEAYREGLRLHEAHYQTGDYSGLLAPSACTRLAELAELRGAAEEAAALCAQALRMDPRCAPALYRLLRIFAAGGADDAAAIEALRTLYPDDTAAAFLASVLAASPFPRAAVCGSRCGGAGCSRGRRRRQRHRSSRSWRVRPPSARPAAMPSLMIRRVHWRSCSRVPVRRSRPRPRCSGCSDVSRA